MFKALRMENDACTGCHQCEMMCSYGKVGAFNPAKSVMDGVATLAMVPRFGWGPMLAVIPVVALQGTVTMLARSFEPIKDNPELIASISLTGGLMVMTIVLVILEVRKVPLADYLPSLVVAPLMAKWLFA